MLDCATPEGRKWIERQKDVAAIVADRWDCTPILTPVDRESPVDVLFERRLVLTAVGEVKCRDLTLEQLCKLGSYLVTAEKLSQGMTIARSLCVPYLLIVGLRDAIVWWMVADADGMRIPYRVASTETKATCNGGQATRENAYLPLDSMRVIRE